MTEDAAPGGAAGRHIMVEQGAAQGTAQGAAEAFLAAPETHGGAAVRCFVTHAAKVFVAGDRAYKIKRAVRYPYLDFSTLERRREAIEKELQINRRTAPELYLDVRPLSRGEDGRLRLGREGEAKAGGAVVEWVLVMRAFDQAGLLDQLAESGGLTPVLLTELADVIRRFHDRAEPIGRAGVAPHRSARGGASGMRDTVVENDQDFTEHPDLFPPARTCGLTAASEDAIARHEALLEARWDRGLVRHCHGDLHLRNICLIDGRPTLFDAIEFNDAIACIDVLYDLAFLLMDLDERGLRPAANLVLNRYLRDGAELESLAALPLFLSVRAAIRAKVAAAAQAGQGDRTAKQRLAEEARDYFAAAEAYLAPPPPRLVAVGGLSGSGKSTLARAVAPDLGAAPGAVVLRSDVTRKALYGLADEAPLPQEAYRPEVSERVYGLLLQRARVVLRAGHAVVLDAVHAKPAERGATEALASDLCVPFTGLWLDAGLDTLVRRTTARHDDASDATPDVVRAQAERDVGAMTWQRLDAARPPEAVAEDARRSLDCAR
jgi:aminoglycoside phosphotransferase family enzyme/predicted kinase